MAVYCAVVSGLLCPNISWTARRSCVPAYAVVAARWRRVCVVSPDPSAAETVLPNQCGVRCPPGRCRLARLPVPPRLAGDPDP